MSEELEILRRENETLKSTVKELRRQLAAYQTQTKRQWYADQDYVSYHDEDRYGNDSASLG